MLGQRMMRYYNNLSYQHLNCQTFIKKTLSTINKKAHLSKAGVIVDIKL